MAVASLLPLPRHVAIIMDGNGRWAERHGLERPEGHRAGAEAVHRVVQHARSIGIQELTLYAFSAQNWDRPASEVDHLMGLLQEFIHVHLPDLLGNGIRLSMIGDQEPLPQATQTCLSEGIKQTAEALGMTLCLALNYGAREEIVQATRSIAEAVQTGALSPENIDMDLFEEHLHTAHLAGDPDLVVRTSGEQRLSNFLLWQAAYAEFYFTPTLWPDFGAAEFDEAIATYRRRKRRFGRIENSQNRPARSA
jgi:undecaprenyl diphosphate synthase